MTVSYLRLNTDRVYEGVADNASLNTDSMVTENEDRERVAKQRLAIYIRNIITLCTATEKIYKLNVSNYEGIMLVSLPIKEFMPAVHEIVNYTDATNLVQLNSKVCSKMSVLNYLSTRLDFFDRNVLHFEGFNNLELMVDVLNDFRKQSKVTPSSKQLLNGIVEVLSGYEKFNISYIQSPSYRLFRLFLINVYFSNYVDASIISELLLSQIYLSYNKKDRSDNNE